MRFPLRDRIRTVRASLYLSAIDGLAHSLARVRFSMPDARPSRFHLRLERDISYGPLEGPDHKLDAYVPLKAPRPLPVVMYVHGGGFRVLSKDTHQVMALPIARAGCLVFNINYRQGPRHPYPAPLEDACRALLWVQQNCARYGGDPSRIALAGESAGGNLVTALAVASSWRRPEPFAREVFDANVALRAVVATYGFLDLGFIEESVKNPRMKPWLKEALLGSARTYVGSDLAAGVRANPLASPLRVIEGGSPERPLPPFFASVGTRDPFLPCSKRLKEALDRLGTECELHLSPGEIHGYDAMMWRPNARAKWRAARAFLGRHMAPAGAIDPGDVRAAV